MRGPVRGPAHFALTNLVSQARHLASRGLTSPWVEAVVRHCRANEDHYRIGCQFRDRPPWNVLLLFG